MCLCQACPMTRRPGKEIGVTAVNSPLDKDIFLEFNQSCPNRRGEKRAARGTQGMLPLLLFHSRQTRSFGPGQRACASPRNCPGHYKPCRRIPRFRSGWQEMIIALPSSGFNPKPGAQGQNSLQQGSVLTASVSALYYLHQKRPEG